MTVILALVREDHRVPLIMSKLGPPGPDRALPGADAGRVIGSRPAR